MNGVQDNLINCQLDLLFVILDWKVFLGRRKEHFNWFKGYIYRILLDFIGCLDGILLEKIECILRCSNEEASCLF